MKGGDVRCKTQPVAWPNSGEIDSGGDGFWSQLLMLQMAAFGSVFGDGNGREVMVDLRAFVRYLPRPMRWP